MNRFQWQCLLAAALVAVLLGVGAFLPSRIVGDLISGAGQLQHAIGLGLIGFLVVVALPSWWIPFSVVALVAGGLVEIVQPFFGRGGQWSDFGANTVGLLVGVSAALLLRRVRDSG